MSCRKSFVCEAVQQPVIALTILSVSRAMDGVAAASVTVTRKFKQGFGLVVVVTLNPLTRDAAVSNVTEINNPRNLPQSRRLAVARRLLERIGEPEQVRFGIGARDKLQTDGQPSLSQARRHANGRQPGLRGNQGVGGKG